MINFCECIVNIYKVSMILDLLINKEFPDEEIRAEVFGFLFAGNGYFFCLCFILFYFIWNSQFILILKGYETTATLLSWTLGNLALHQDIQRKVIEEIDKILEGKQPKWEDMDKLKYTMAVIYETLRHDSPVTAVTREALVDNEVENIFIPKGVIIIIIITFGFFPLDSLIHNFVFRFFFRSQCGRLQW